MNLKHFYIVVALGTWGKALSRSEAISNAKVQAAKTHHVVNIAILKPETPDEVVANLLACFNVDDWGAVYLYHNPSEEDQAQIDAYLIGWITEVINKPKIKA